MLPLQHVVTLDGISTEAVRPISRVEYDRLIEMGWFADERLELLGGVLVTMSPQKPPHAGTVAALHERLTRTLGDRAHVRCQLPLAATDDSEPEPDLAVVTRADYRTAHPTTALLVIEVADTTLDRDRRKAALYAAAGVPDYWIVDLAAGRLHVHTAPDPAAATYASVTQHRPGETVAPAAFPDVPLALADILG